MNEHSKFEDIQDQEESKIGHTTPILRSDVDKHNKTSGNDFSATDKIKVFLRIRPCSGTETSMNYKIDANTITIRPPNNRNYFCVDKSFTFRHILDTQATQEDVFETVAHPLLSDFLRGNDVLIFCYGCTNAGKTYTVNGTPENPGLLERSLSSIVPENIHKKNVKLFVSFLEIYNEKIIDLLSDPKSKTQLVISTGNDRDTEIRNLNELEVSSMNDIRNVVSQGNAARHRGVTDFNCESSRSHTIFRLRLQQKSQCSYLSIVDLAGCERMSVSNITHESLKESSNINKSMLALGKCIRCLRQNPTGSVPYRDSRLTHLFKTFFEPTLRPSKAAMIINISPSVSQIEDTVFALQFAAEASECKIRQVSRPDGGFVDDETQEEIETRIRSHVQEEFESLMNDKQNQFKIKMESLEESKPQIQTFKNPMKADDKKVKETQELEEKFSHFQQLQSTLAIRQKSADDELRISKQKLENLQQMIYLYQHENAQIASSISNLQKRKEELLNTIANERLIYATTGLQF